MGKIIYSKYSNDRAPQYMIATDIIEENDGKIVRKRAVNPSAYDHVMSMKKHYEVISPYLENTKLQLNTIVGEGKEYLDFEYVEGKGFEQCLDELLDAGEYEQMIQIMQSFYDEIARIGDKEYQDNDRFEYYFGKEKCLTGYKCIPFGNVDLIFQNVIIRSDHEWCIIDYEWTLDCYIPVKYLIYRSIFLYIYGRSNRSKLIERNLFDLFGITKQEEDMFARMEEHFQSVIKSGHRNFGDYYQYMGMPSINSQVMFARNESRYMEIYYDYGYGLFENKMVFSGNQVKAYLTPGTKAIRIVPMPCECLVNVIDISDNNGNTPDYSFGGRIINNDTYLLDAECPFLLVENIDDGVSYINISLEVSEITAKVRNDIIGLQLRNENDTIALKNAKDTVDNIYDSVSWKITKPMRAAGDGVTGLKRLARNNRAGFVIKSGLKYLAHNGIRSTIRRTKELYGHNKNVLSADDFTLSEEQIAYQKNYEFKNRPLISVLVPLYNTPEEFLREMIESVTFQTYSDWELCLADGSDDEHSFVGDICKEYSDRDDRVVYKHLDENLGISDNTNACMKMAKGDYIGLFDHDDLLTQDALFEVVKKLNEDQSVEAVYTDEDKYLYDGKKKTGTYVQPHFKSDFNLDLLRSCNYICHFFVVKKSIADEVGGFRKEFDGSQDFDFIFRCVEKADKVAHIPKILYHWRIHANSTAASPEKKMYCYEAGRHAIEEHLKRNGIDAEVMITDNLGYYRVKYPVFEQPLVSIVIINKDNRRTLQKCIESIIRKSTYKNYEIIVVDNNSESEDIKEYYRGIANVKNINIEYWKNPGNYSQMINYGVEKIMGDFVIFIDNHTEVITEDWIEEMLSNCQRNDVGIVGAKLIYPDNTIRHCGGIIGLGGIAGDAYAGLDANYLGNSGRALAHQNLSAVSSACMMTTKEVFDKVGGFEEKLRESFGDVDYCLRVREEGYLVVMNPDVRIYYHKSKEPDNRNEEYQKEYDLEEKYMTERWKEILAAGDPYYNKNLTLLRSDFSMKDKNEEQ